MTDPILSVHRPHGSDTWQVVREGPRGRASEREVLVSDVTNEQAWAHSLVHYYGEDPVAFTAALNSLAEVEDGT